MVNSDRPQRVVLSAAILSIAAGAVHLAASGAHSDIATLGLLIGGAGVGQVAFGVLVLVAPGSRNLLATGVFNFIAVLAWVASRTVGLPLPGAAGEVQTVGVQDVIAAVLGAGVVGATLLAFSSPSRDKAIDSGIAAVVGISLTLIAISVPHNHAGVDQSVPILEAGRLSARLPESEAMALLGVSARPPLAGATGHSHSGDGGHGAGFEKPPPPEPLSGAELATFEQQWADAVATAKTLATVDQAAAAGYAQAATEAPGVGAHWVKWSLVDKPFDPARPSMLLYSNLRYGQPPELVGFSYWVASADEPEGFAGPNDTWHTHHGMCFVDGWLRYENVDLRSDCTDTWIDGSDLWMLHAWPVPGSENRWGLFADMNPALCRTKPQTPDIMGCDPAGI